MMATPAEAQPALSSPSLGARERAARFCRSFGLRVPILQAPMAGACPASLASAVANGGGMGGLGALTTPPAGIADWVREFRDQSNGGFQINLWIPDPPPVRDPQHERKVREFLGKWGPPVPAEAGNVAPLDFAAQCQALLAAAPRVVSSIMGLFPDKFIAEIKARGIAWFACATTLAEARAAVGAGADAIVAQGSEAGGHRDRKRPAGPSPAKFPPVPSSGPVELGTLAARFPGPFDCCREAICCAGLTSWHRTMRATPMSMPSR
jgi:nitronate monooxygenase